MEDRPGLSPRNRFKRVAPSKVIRVLEAFHAIFEGARGIVRLCLLPGAPIHIPTAQLPPAIFAVRFERGRRPLPAVPPVERPALARGAVVEGAQGVLAPGRVVPDRFPAPPLGAVSGARGVRVRAEEAAAAPDEGEKPGGLDRGSRLHLLL
ncbi:hypothetical protein ACHAWF_003584 [Thalassiosira exigua]